MILRILWMAIYVSFFVVSMPMVRAQAEMADDADARALFQLGQSAFDAGRYEAALDFFQRAYDLSHRPQLLYNIGQAADRLRRDRRALEAFEGFLRDAPESPQHASTRSRVAVLRATVEAEEARARSGSDVAPPTPAETAAAANQDPPTDAPQSSGRGPSIAGWTIVGGGAGVLAVGAVFVILGFGDRRAVEGAPDGSLYASVEDAYDRSARRITVGSVLVGVGAAAAATGIVVALRGGSQDADTETVHLHVAPNGVTLRGMF